MDDRYQSICSDIARSLGARRTWLLDCSCETVLHDLLALPRDFSVCESLDTKPVRCLDLRLLAAQAREQGMPFVVDGTLTGVHGCAGIRLGAHVEVIDTEDATIVAVARDVGTVFPELIERLDQEIPLGDAACEEVSNWIQRQDAWWRATSDAAQVVASYLRCHPRVGELAYPGLKGDSSFGIAARTLQNGFGPYVCWRSTSEDPWHLIKCTDEDARLQVMGLEEALAQ